MFIRSERLFLRPVWPEDRLAFPCLADTASHGLRFPAFVITVPGESGSEAIGLVALEPARDAARLRLWIAPGHRGRGFAGEALGVVSDAARSLGHACLLADADGPAAVRLAHKAGFREARSLAGASHVLDLASDGDMPLAA